MQNWHEQRIDQKNDKCNCMRTKEDKPIRKTDIEATTTTQNTAIECIKKTVLTQYLPRK